jgi:hypothetical protein
MPTNLEVVDKSKEQNPMLGLFGFIVLVVVGGVSFLISGPLTQYLTTARVTIGAANIKLLPIKFPVDWSPLADQLAVTLVVFLIIFVIVMIIMFMFMKPSSEGEMSVNLDVMRKEVQDRKKVR